MRNADINIVDTSTGKVVYMAREIKGADPKSFERLGGKWARDARHVFYAGQRIAKIDAESFRRLNQSYGIDKNGVFFRMFFFPDADSTTFQVLDSGLLLYEVDTFSGEDTRGYAKDAQHVWFGHLKVRDADAASFSSLGNGYGRDKNSAFYREKQIVGAAITSWRYWRADMSLDEQNVFYRFKKIKDVDRRSVVHLSVQNCIADRNGVFMHDKRVAVEEYLGFTNLPAWEREALTSGKLFDRILDEWPHSH